MDLHTETGPIVLGRPIGKGGEGLICEIEDRPGQLAKVYHRPPTEERVDKLRAMIAVGSAELAVMAAWPAELVRGRDGAVAGFTMPRAEGRELHVLYGPTTRRREFPRADWRFLVRAAANLARAVGRVHRAGSVIGDLNPRGVMVSQRATVQLIDCDSFQITAGDRVLPCDVGVGMFAPPELQGGTFRGVERTPDQDGFGLAVLLFHLLFVGRHPFAGRTLGAGDPPSLEAAIAAYRFAYSAHPRDLAPPPGMIGLELVPPAVAALFERAFAPHATRPTPGEWVTALGALEQGLVRCDVRSTHLFAETGSGCPWCALERRLRVDFFPVERAPAFDPEAVWRAITAVAAPELPAPRLAADAPPVGPSEEALASVRARRARATRAALGLGALIAGLIVAVGPAAVVLGAPALYAVAGRAPSAPEALRAKVAEARAEWQRRLDAVRAAPRPVEAEQLLVRLTRTRDDLRARESEAAEARTRRAATQRRAFLERHLLSEAKIDGIGASSLDALGARGIETAADVVRANMMDLQGFGEARIERVLAWRRSIEAQFAPAEADPGEEISRLRAALTAAPAKLGALHAQAAEAHHARVRAADEALAAWRQAEADEQAAATRSGGALVPVLVLWAAAVVGWLAFAAGP